MKIAKLALAAAALTTTAAVAPTVATAQKAAAVTAGATVYGNDGAEIGTVESIDGETAILVVDGMKAPVPAAAFGTGEQGATLNATKAQIVGMLQAAQQQAMAKRDAALVVGAEAVTAKNAPLGTVLEIEGDNVIIARGGDETKKITLLREHFAAAPDGSLMALMTNAQIDAAMASAAPAADTTARIVDYMRDNGILMGRTGLNRNVLKIRTPMPFSRDNVDQLMSVLDERLSSLA